MDISSRYPRRVVVLGSTGSIGTQTIDVARRHPDKIKVVALAAGGRRVAELFDQVREFDVDKVAIASAPKDGIDSLDVPVLKDGRWPIRSRWLLAAS